MVTIIKEVTEWVEGILPLLYTHQLTKAEHKLSVGSIQAYWAGTVIRIDFKPCE